MATAKPIVTYKDIPGHPGYRIGDDGSVWSRRRPGYRASVALRDAWMRLRGRVCRVSKYPDRVSRVSRVDVKLSGKRKAVHHLVLTLFVGPCPPGMEACHNDGDPLNNRLDNLRWDTHVSNMADQVKHGTATKGCRNGGAKLAEREVRDILRDLAAGATQISIAAKHGVRQTSVSNIAIGATWKDIPRAS